MGAEGLKMMADACLDQNSVLVLCSVLVPGCPLGTWPLLHPHVCDKSFGSALLAAFPAVGVRLRVHNRQRGR